MKTCYRRRRIRGFTLVELLVSIAILAVLAGLSFSVVARAGTKAKLTASLARVRDLGPMILIYSQENGGRLPVWKDEGADLYWWEQIADPDQYDAERLFKSPGHKGFDPERVDATISYGWNVAVMGRSETLEEAGDEAGTMVAGRKRLAAFRRPEGVLVLADGAREEGYGRIEPGGPLPDPERYKGKVAGLMLDGSSQVLDAAADFGEDSKWFRTGDF